MAKQKYYQRPDGLYESIRKINGRRVAFRGKTCREVDRKILAYQEQAQAGRPFPVVAAQWQREHDKTVSLSTQMVYGYAVKRLCAAFPKSIRDVKPLDVKRYLNDLERAGYSAQTVQTDLSVCKMICSYAVISGDIDVSPATEIRKSRGLPVKRREALTEEQEAIVKRVSAERKAHFWLFGCLLLYTGMRRGEALALTYGDIDRKAGVIHVTKKLSYATGQMPVLEDHLKSENGRRDIPLLPPLAAALPRNRAGLIFPGEDGGFMRSSEITKNWRRYCRDAGLFAAERASNGETVETFPITPHCFRHSMATICYEAGLDPRQTARILGDAVETVEGVYTHLRQQRQKSAAEILAEYCK